MILDDQAVKDIAAAVAERLVGRPQPRLLTIEGAADYLSRSPGGIRQLIHRGILPTVKLDARVYLDIRDLDKVIERSKERAI